MASGSISSSSQSNTLRSSLPYLLLSLLFHLLYLSSIFQIYFTSPVVYPANRFSLIDTYPSVQLQSSTSPPQSTFEQVIKTSKPPAERLVLIVGDGLRADTVLGKHDFRSFPDWAKYHLINTKPESEVRDRHPGHSPFPNALLEDRTLSSDQERKLKAVGVNGNETAERARYEVAPYIRSKALKDGAWGISHTRVPTESRPGHVAMIAGMYEDVSAVTKGEWQKHLESSVQAQIGRILSVRKLSFVPHGEGLPKTGNSPGGWKQNPMPFDSVLNQSSNTFAFGSPDIVPMFSRGATEGKVRQWCYREEDEDFTGDATHLDLWVLNEFRNLLDSSKSSPALAASLKERGNIFFLHLLGPDTTGHTFRPFSPEYLGNTIVVDSIVQEVERLMREHFKDDRTAFVFTADHGMSKLGNHGDGESDNTRTPLVAWGSGVRSPRPIGNGKANELSRRFGSNVLQDAQQSWRVQERAEDDYFRGWSEFDDVWREDVEQGDITPLMASLLSLPQPGNSEGRLPLDYLDPALGEEHKARASLTNALQILESYRVKDGEYLKPSLAAQATEMLRPVLSILPFFFCRISAQRSSKSLAYQPFPPLAPGPSPFRSPGSQQVSRIKAELATKHYAEALALCGDLITLALEGAQYLQTYDWLLLVSMVTLGYLGSVFYGIIFVAKRYALSPQEVQLCSDSLGLGSAISAIAFSVLSLRLFLESSPITYHLYALFPAFFWGRVIDQRKVLVVLLRRVVSQQPKPSSSSTATRGAPLTFSNVINAVSKLLAAIILMILALELIVIGYLHRIAWTIGFFALGFMWPIWGWSSEIRKRNEALAIAWGAVCTVTAMFTLAGTEKEESRIGLALSGITFLTAGLMILRYPSLFLGASEGSRLKFWQPSPDVVLRHGKNSTSNSEQTRGSRADPHLDRTIQVLGGELVILVISTMVTLSSSKSLQLKRGLPLANQVLGWGVLASCLTLPFFLGFQPPKPHPDDLQKQISQPIAQRLAIFIFAFAPVFVLLSLRDETLFFFSYIATLLIWSKVEATLCEEYQNDKIIKENLKRVDQPQRKDTANGEAAQKTEQVDKKHRTLRSSEIRTSLTFLFLLHVGFFGTGNVASISSFYLSPVYRLVPIFNPFLMATLLLLKILVPFVVLSSIFQVLCLSPTRSPLSAAKSITEETQSDRTLEMSLMEGPDLLGKNSAGGLGLRDSFSLTLIACIAADILALNFLFTVRTDGSWLEIGRTITHFAMANLLQIFMLALATLSELLMGKGTSHL